MIFINFCEKRDLLQIPGIGDRLADKILEVRHVMGNITEDVFLEIPYLRVTKTMLNMLNFSPRYETPMDSQKGVITSSQKADDEYGQQARPQMKAKYQDHQPVYKSYQEPVGAGGSMGYGYQNNPEQEQDYYRPQYSSHQQRMAPPNLMQPHGGYKMEPDTYRPQRYGGRNDDLPKMRVQDRRYTPSEVKPVRTNIPKSLKFDGTPAYDWKVFSTKFMKFVESNRLSAKDCTENLCWILEGKASEYFTVQLERNPGIEFFDIMSKMERRFGFKELAETSQARLRTAKQYPDEKLTDWTDRVLSLATKAFKDLPEEFMYQQAILTICQGAYDKEAGQHASNLRLATIEEVIDTMRWFQHNRKAIYGRDRVTSPAKSVLEEDEDEAVNVNRAYGQQRSFGGKQKLSYSKPNTGSSPQDDKGPSLVEQRLSTLEEKVGRMETSLNKILKIITPQPGKQCYECGNEGHFRYNCPELKKKETAQVQAVSEEAEEEEEGHLNLNGTDKEV